MSASSVSQSSTLRMVAQIQQRQIDAERGRLDAGQASQAKVRAADARLEQLESAELKYRAEEQRSNKPVYSLRLEDGTKIDVFSGGGVVGSGPRGAIVMGLDELARKAGFAEPKTPEEQMLQRIAMLELHYAEDDVRKKARADLENMKKAIALLGKVLQMFKDGLKSGAIPYTPVAGTGGNDMMKVLASGMRIQAGAGDDTIYSSKMNIVEAGEGNDTVLTASENSVDGGAGDDLIAAGSDSRVTGGDGNDTIKIRSNGTVDGGAGNDVVLGYSAAAIDTGAGEDVVQAFSVGRIDSGDGDDVIRAHSGGSIAAGAGNDFIDAKSAESVDAGDGDDVIEAWSTRVAGGAGNDLIRAGASDVDGGAGNDVIDNWGNGVTQGGAGDDVIKAGGTIDGGDGNDAIVSNGYAKISGGRGDDQILATGKDTITFGKGDGRDTVGAWSPSYSDLGGGVRLQQTRAAEDPAKAAQVTFNISAGLSQQDLQMSVHGADVTLDFGGGDSITILDYKSLSATMVFADGSRVQVSDYVARQTAQAAAAPPAPGNQVSLTA
jgi:hypothetical protein